MTPLASQAREWAVECGWGDRRKTARCRSLQSALETAWRALRYWDWVVIR